MNFRTLSASMINQESNSAAIIPLLTLKLSLVSTLVNHHTKNREKIPGILLNFYLLIIKQERITVCLANSFLVSQVEIAILIIWHRRSDAFLYPKNIIKVGFNTR